MTLPASDTFTGTDGTPLTTYSANWSLNAGNFEIISNEFRSNAASADTAARWNADSFDPDQYAEVKFVEITGATFAGPAVRCSTSGAATYYGYYSSGSTHYLFKSIGGGWTVLAASGGGVADQAIMRIEAEGSTITPKIDGVIDSAIGSQTDSAIASGAAGICGYDSIEGSRGDDFLAGNLAAPPAAGVGGDWIQSEFLPYAVGAGGGMYGGG